MSSTFSSTFSGTTINTNYNNYNNNNSNNNMIIQPTSSQIYRISLTNHHLLVFNNNLSHIALIDDCNQCYFSPQSKSGLYIALIDKFTAKVHETLFVSSFENLEQTALLILLLSRHKTSLKMVVSSGGNENENEHFLVLASKGKWFTTDHLKLYGALVDKMEHMFHYSMPLYSESEHQNFFAIFDLESQISILRVDDLAQPTSSSSSSPSSAMSSPSISPLSPTSRPSSPSVDGEGGGGGDSGVGESSYSKNGIEFLYVDCPVTRSRVPHVFHETVRRMRMEIDELRRLVKQKLDQSIEVGSTEEERNSSSGNRCDSVVVGGGGGGGGGDSNHMASAAVAAHASNILSPPPAAIATTACGAIADNEPIGVIKMFFGTVSSQSIPHGWLPCLGQVLNRSEFPKLYDHVSHNMVLAQQFRVSDTQFKLPSLCQNVQFSSLATVNSPVTNSTMVHIPHLANTMLFDDPFHGSQQRPQLHHHHHHHQSHQQQPQTVIGQHPSEFQPISLDNIPYVTTGSSEKIGSVDDMNFIIYIIKAL